MKRSGDPGIGDMARHRAGGTLEDVNRNLTTEARRRREGGGDWGIKDLAHRRVIGLRSALRIAVAALREIFDESAYDRFLLRTQGVRSVESYREFLKDREGAAARRPRCC